MLLIAVSWALAQAPSGPLVPLAYAPGTSAGNIARFSALSEKLKFVPGPEDARPLEVVTCPDRAATVPLASALAALKRGLALAGVELRAEGRDARLVAVAPAPAEGPLVLVLPTAPADAVVAGVGASVEPVDGAVLVVSTVDRRPDVVKALCPTPP